jgi:biotin carboxyl carrier protein
MKSFKFKINETDYEAEVLEVVDNVLSIKLNGTDYNVSLDESVETPKPVVKPVAKPSVVMPTAAKNEEGSVYQQKSPLPGTVLEVKVRIGDSVSAGQKILLLEAMKMENNIEADQAGIIKDIKVSKGDAVMEGDVLVVIE